MRKEIAQPAVTIFTGLAALEQAKGGTVQWTADLVESVMSMAGNHLWETLSADMRRHPRVRVSELHMLEEKRAKHVWGYLIMAAPQLSFDQIVNDSLEPAVTAWLERRMLDQHVVVTLIEIDTPGYHPNIRTITVGEERGPVRQIRIPVFTSATVAYVTEKAGEQATSEVVGGKFWDMVLDETGLGFPEVTPGANIYNWIAANSPERVLNPDSIASEPHALRIFVAPKKGREIKVNYILNSSRFE